MNGVGPSTDLPENALSVPDANYVEAKELQVSRDTVQFGLLAVANESSPVPSDTETGGFTNCTPGDCTSTPASYVVPTASGRKQEKSNWCVPATAQMILASMGVTPPTQTVLAKEMGTSTNARGGTNPAYLPASLNKRESRNKYVYHNDTSSPAHLVARAMTDTYQYKSTFQLTLDVATAGYYPAGWTGTHSVNVYGYYTQNNGGLYIWDVEDARMFGATDTRYGKHTMKAATAYASMDTAGWGIVW